MKPHYTNKYYMIGDKRIAPWNKLEKADVQSLDDNEMLDFVGYSGEGLEEGDYIVAGDNTDIPGQIAEYIGCIHWKGVFRYEEEDEIKYLECDCDDVDVIDKKKFEGLAKSNNSVNS